MKGFKGWFILSESESETLGDRPALPLQSIFFIFIFMQLSAKIIPNVHAPSRLRRGWHLPQGNPGFTTEKEWPETNFGRNGS